MPSRHTVKQYVEGGYYHAYNRGVEKRTIFVDPQDYRVFENYLKLLLLAPQLRTERRMKNYYGKIELINYCLMPNHFHLQLRQQTQSAMAEFMRSLLTAYSMYFNLRHQRVGALFQGPYKAALIDTDEYMMHLARYINLNPQKLGLPVENYPYSSLSTYLGDKDRTWIQTQSVMQFFRDAADYHNFMTSSADSAHILGELTLE